MREPLEKIVKEAIVISKNKKEYLDMIRRLVPLNEQICKLLDDYNFTYEFSDDAKSPTCWLIVNLGSYKESLFSVEYSYLLEFSKIVNVRKDSFSFKIKNCDPDTIVGRFLSGDDCVPLTKTHYNFYKELNAILDVISEKLDYNDLHEVLCDLDFITDSMKFFSAQPNVDLILFHDFFCNIGDDDIWDAVTEN